MKEVYISPNFYQLSGARGKDKGEKFVAVWDNRFLENVKLCSERIPGGYVEISRATLWSKSSRQEGARSVQENNAIYKNFFIHIHLLSSSF